MKSPFPGMDPYLEEHWEDVHARLISYVADELQPQLAEDLIARMEEKVYVEDEGESRRRKPDVRVVELPTEWAPEPGHVGMAVLEEPVMLEPVGDQIRQRSVLIYDSDGNRIVTAVEILSPWNKTPGRSLREYLEKREKYVQSRTSLVEIDLIRAGDWLEMIGPFTVPRNRRTIYRVTVTTPMTRGPWHYAISLQSKLPTIKVPLRVQDLPAVLDLQKLMDKAYLMGRYDRTDYTKPCRPPLTGDDKVWVDELLRDRPARSSESSPRA